MPCGGRAGSGTDPGPRRRPAAGRGRLGVLLLVDVSSAATVLPRALGTPTVAHAASALTGATPRRRPGSCGSSVGSGCARSPHDVEGACPEHVRVLALMCRGAEPVTGADRDERLAAQLAAADGMAVAAPVEPAPHRAARHAEPLSDRANGESFVPERESSRPFGLGSPLHRASGSWWWPVARTRWASSALAPARPAATRSPRALVDRNTHGSTSLCEQQFARPRLSPGLKSPCYRGV